MSEIKTVEQYVITELEDLKRKNAALMDRNENLAAEVAYSRNMLKKIAGMLKWEDAGERRFLLEVWEKFDQEDYLVLKKIALEEV